MTAPSPSGDERIFWCASCGAFVPASARTFAWSCPRCGSAIRDLRCARCGHGWTPRSRTLPKTCPSCNSYLYAVRPVRDDAFRRRLRSRSGRRPR